MNTFSQTLAVTRSSLQSLGYRWRISLSTIAGIALVVLVLLGFLSMSEGFKKTLENTGAANIVIIKSKNTKSESMSWIDFEDVAVLESLQGIRKNGQQATISQELYKAVTLYNEDKERKTIGLRGIEGESFALRPGMVLSSGRMFATGSREIIVGSFAAANNSALSIGEEISIAGVVWTIVGMFDVERGLYGAELWTDASSLRDVFKTPPGFNIIRFALAQGYTTDAVQKQLTADPRMTGLDIISEKDFYSDQASGLVKVIEMIGWPIAILMAIGAIAGTINTIYNSVVVQTREISTLRALGFGKLPIFIAVMTEAVVLVIIGGLIGVLLSLLIFNGFEGSTLTGSQSQMSFEFSVTLKSILQAMSLAVVVGFLGGMVPAILAAEKPILEALRQ